MSQEQIKDEALLNAYRLISALLQIDDDEFVDRLLTAVAGGDLLDVNVMMLETKEE